MKNIITVGICFLLVGCGTLIPKEHQEQAAVKTAGQLSSAHGAEVTKRVENQSPPMNIRVEGKDNKVDLKVEAPKTETHVKDTETVEAEGKDSAKGFSISSIPLFVKLIGLAFGIGALGFILIYGVKYLRRTSPAIDAAIGMGDRFIANEISHWEAKAKEHNSAEKQAEINAQLARLEKQRGKFGVEAPQVRGK